MGCGFPLAELGIVGRKDAPMLAEPMAIDIAAAHGALVVRVAPCGTGSVHRPIAAWHLII
jgi:hypothetical protein